MPYISQEDRKRIDAGEDPIKSGELNYVFTQAIIKYVGNKGISYTTFNDIIGALQGAQAEFYRRVVAPYEDFKIKQNGDVF